LTLVEHNRQLSKRIVIIGLVISLLILTIVPVSSGAISQIRIGNRSIQQTRVTYYPTTTSFTGLPYDEQQGISFTQDFSSLTFNVTAIGQTGPDGNGPAYLLSALTDGGYWYQVGVSYKWPNTNGNHLPGFSMNYEVFNNFGQSIDPAPPAGGGILNMTVNSGDIVLLSLNFTSDGNNVAMVAYDWNTKSSARELYGAAGSYFTANYIPGSVADQNGFFTGLMTEQYYETPYKGSGQTVTYVDKDFNYTSAFLWMDEFNTQGSFFQPVFKAQTPSVIDLTSNGWPGYLSSNGTAVAANQHSFVTGLQPLHTVTVHASPLTANVHPGGAATISLALSNTNQAVGKLTNVKVVTDFGTYNVTSAIENIAPGNSNRQIIINVPNTVAVGTHSVTVEGTWQAYDSQLNSYVGQNQIQSTITLPITASNLLNTSGLSTQPFLPLIYAVVAAAIIASLAIFTITRWNRRALQRPQPFLVQYAPACSRCGQFVSSNMTYCPNCGLALHGTIQSDLR
jgi:hypothetical protein